MSMHLIQDDIKLMRNRYDEALSMQGIPCKYQYPISADSNVEGESVIDSYSTELDTFVFFDGSPKVKTYKRLGWVVENSDELPFLIYCSFQLPEVQKDAIFRIAGLYTDVPERVFRVTEITYDMQAPDHLICQVVPEYNKQLVGRTDIEVAKTFNTSSHFLRPSIDYRGQYYDPDSSNGTA